MKNIPRLLAYFTLPLFLLSETLYAQERLKVTEPDVTRMPLLSRLASIDSRKDSIYIVYASPKEKEALQQAHFRFESYPDDVASKALSMANSLGEMSQWNRYPTYSVYLQMMQHFASEYPSLCCIDTIGTSVQGRLILCARLTSQQLPDSMKPQFFYSSTIHGDELTGFPLMLRLIDTLLAGYGNNSQYTHLLDSLQVYINPLANPDGTYYSSNDAVGGSQRYNANYVDLNRNYPDPFGTAPLDEQQPENTAMIAYFQTHRFRLSANLHGGTEVLNYPWDSFESSEHRHPSDAWWQRICAKFIDTLRACQNDITMTNELQRGYIEGGDWYVIRNGRQDWVNAKMDCLEMTMEISIPKRLSSSLLPTYWEAYQHPFVNYIKCALRDTVFLSDSSSDDPLEIGVADAFSVSRLFIYPNPSNGHITLSGTSQHPVELLDVYGRHLERFPAGTTELYFHQPSGIYILRCGKRQTVLLLNQ